MQDEGRPEAILGMALAAFCAGVFWVPVGIWIADSFATATMVPAAFFLGGLGVTGFVWFMRRFDPTEPPDPHA
jgi:hypothetical protein